MSHKTGVNILSLEAKDLYLANRYVDGTDNTQGYNIRKQDGSINTGKFINTLDYSLDLIKLREVYYKVYRNQRFSFWENGYEYTKSVINVTFNYSNKEYNPMYGGLYLREGYNYKNIELSDCTYTVGDNLVAIQTNKPVEDPLPQEVLGNCFKYDEESHTYQKEANIPAVTSVADLRKELYTNGFTCDGVEYVRFKRSSGSSRVGKCLFIDKKLYSQMHRWEMCGLTVKQGQSIDLAGLESYISLTLSSIIDTIEIQPKNILVIDDYESVFKDKVVSTELGKDGWLKSEEKIIDVHNNIWDGQSLLDSSLFGKYSQYGFLLLRNRFFKSACFNTKIQQWFADNNITDVSQLNGFTLADDISDIKLITTPSSIKYLKFGKLETWLSKIDSTFGVVKHEKPPKGLLKKMVQCHYQLINTLQLTYEEVEEFLAPSLDYLEKLRNDPDVLKYHIKYPGDKKFQVRPMYSTNEVVYNLLSLNTAFTRTKLYHNFKKDLINSFISNMRMGHIYVDGNYSVMIGNGIEMLQSAIGKFDGKSVIGVGNISSKRFEYDTDILGTRSPHVTMGNILVTHNTYNEDIEKYFNLTEEIVYVNSINENLLNRLSGSDFDSDTVLLTDNPVLLRAAKRNYNVFSVPTSDVEAKKIERYYSSEQQADLDIKTSVNKIGEIVNLSQIANSILWNRVNKGASFDDVKDLYFEISKLDVMSNIEIDKAKREYPIDSGAEIDKIRNSIITQDSNGRRIMPKFFSVIEKSKGYYDSERKQYKKHETAMDYLQAIIEKHILIHRKDKLCIDGIMGEYQYRYNSKTYTVSCCNVKYKRDGAKIIKHELDNDCTDKISYLLPSQISIEKDMVYIPSEFQPFSSIINFKNYDIKKVWYQGAYNIIDKVRETKSICKKYWGDDSMDVHQKYKLVNEVKSACVNYIEAKRIGKTTMMWLLSAIERPENKDISRMLMSILLGCPNREFMNLLLENKEDCKSLVQTNTNNKDTIFLYGYLFKKV